MKIVKRINKLSNEFLFIYESTRDNKVRQFPFNSFAYFCLFLFLEFNNHTVVQKSHNSSETVDLKINIKVYFQIYVNFVCFLLFGVQ